MTRLRRALLLAVIVASIQIALHAARLVPESFPALAGLEAAIARGADVLLLGDSTIPYVAPGEAPATSIPELLEREIAPLRLATFASAGYQASLARDAVRRLLRQGWRGRCVLVEVNLSSFAPLWSESPQMQFARERLILRHGDRIVAGSLLRPFFVFKGPHLLDRLQERRFARLKARLEGGRQERFAAAVDRLGRRTGSDEDFVDVVTLRYGPALDPGHRFVRDLAALAADLRAARVPAVFYVTPVDVESLRSIAGPHVVETVRANAATLAAVLRSRGAVVLDLAGRLPARDFSWRPTVYPNEHLAESGRRRLVGELAAGVRDLP